MQTTFFQRLYYTGARINSNESLNAAAQPEKVAAERLLLDLKQVMNQIKAQAFQSDGTVSYAALKDTPIHHDFRRLTAQLRTFPLDALTHDDERKAFWINLYNLLIVDAVIFYGVQKTVQEVRGFFARAAYQIGGLRFSADDIEHGILRANAGHPAIPGPQFSANDPRWALALKVKDPRIHFALNCASTSCPLINLYDAGHLDAQLDLAARNFINSEEVAIDVANKRIDLSKIFQWYAPDFGGGVFNQLGIGSYAAVLKFMAAFIEDAAQREALNREPNLWKVRFKKYNWALNGLLF